MGILTRRAFGFGVLSATASAGSLARADSKSPLVVIIAADSPISALEIGDLRRTYLGKPLEIAGRRIIPLNQLPHTPPREQFDRKLLDMSPDEVGRYWIDRRIQGGASPPRSLPNSALLRRVVARLPGAIGYIYAHEVDAQVKVLKIGGKSPGDSGYPLAV